MLLKNGLFACAIGLSMLGMAAFGQDSTTVSVTINGDPCNDCAIPHVGYWTVAAGAASGTINVTGTGGAVIQSIAIKCEEEGEHVTLNASGNIASIGAIYQDFSGLEGPPFLAGELWIGSVTAGSVLDVAANIITTITASGLTIQDVYQLPSSLAASNVDGIGTLLASNGDIKGVISADRRIGAIRAPNGSIGESSSARANINSRTSIGSIEAEELFADIVITTLGGSPQDIDWINVTEGDFVGLLTCRKITGTDAPGPYGLFIEGDLDADITHTAVMNTDWRIGGSFAANRVIDLPSQGLTRQMIFAGSGSGTWAGSAHIELNNSALNGEPSYTNAANTVGGGSAGLATFDVHHESCNPVEGASVIGYGPHYTCIGEEDCCERFKKAYVRMYGPIEQTQSPAVTVKYRPAGSSSSFTAVSWTVVTAISGSDPRTLEVYRSGNVAWEPGDGYEYLIEPISGRLKSDEVDGTPNVVDFDYKFTLTNDCGSEQGFVSGGFDMNNDGYMTSADVVSWSATPRDLTADGQANAADLARLMRIVARFSN